MCFTTCDRPSFFESKVVTATREHLCCECGVTIGRGEKYERESGRWSDGFASYATCSQCRELRDMIVAFEREAGCSGEEAVPPYGCVREIYAAIVNGTEYFD